MMMRIRRTRPGLTLIEVLVAMAIMLLALVAIGRLVDIGTQSANEARLTARGTRLAESKMAEVEAGAISLNGGSLEGTFEPEEPSWSWAVEPSAAGPANLYQVTVRVNRTVDGRKFEITLTQMILDPSVMGTSSQAEKTSTSTDTTGTGGTMP
jgi:general secretion pathway protein I